MQRERIPLGEGAIYREFRVWRIDTTVDGKRIRSTLGTRDRLEAIRRAAAILKTKSPGFSKLTVKEKLDVILPGLEETITHEEIAETVDRAVAAALLQGKPVVKSVTGGLLNVEKKAYWSFSSLSQIAERCSLQFYFQRIAKLPPEFTSENLVYGSAIHAAASWMYRLRKEGQRIQANEAPRVQYDEGDTLDSLVNEGRELVNVLVENQRDDETILEIDMPFKVPLKNSRGETLEKPLVGEVDVVVTKPGDQRLVVRDLKTSKKRYAEEKLKHDLQPTAYLFALKQIHP